MRKFRHVSLMLNVTIYDVSKFQETVWEREKNEWTSDVTIKERLVLDIKAVWASQQEHENWLWSTGHTFKKVTNWNRLWATRVISNRFNRTWLVQCNFNSSRWCQLADSIVNVTAYTRGTMILLGALPENSEMNFLFLSHAVLLNVDQISEGRAKLPIFVIFRVRFSNSCIRIWLLPQTAVHCIIGFVEHTHSVQGLPPPTPTEYYLHMQWSERVGSSWVDFFGDPLFR